MKPQKANPSQQNHQYLVSFVIGILLFLNSFLWAYNYSIDSPQIDFFTWWAIPYSVSQGYVQTPYHDEDRLRLAEKIEWEIKTKGTPNVEADTLADILKLYNNRIITTASPFFYSVLGSFITDDYQFDKRRFTILSLVCYTLSVLVLGRLLKFSYPALFVFYALITTWFAPFLSEIKVGNVNQIQLFLTTIFIFLAARDKNIYYSFWAAFFLGFSVFLKPNMCLVLLFALIAAFSGRDMKKVLAYALGFVASGAVAFMQTTWFFKSHHWEVWKGWFEIIPSTVSGYFNIAHGNYSLCKLILSYTGMNISLIVYALLVGVFVWVISHAQRLAPHTDKELKNAFLVVAFGGLTMLLGGSLVWPHYYLLMVPIYLLLLRPIDHTFLSRRHFMTVPLTLFSLAISTTMVTRKLSSQEVCAAKVNLVALLLLVLLIIEFFPQIKKARD